MSDAPLPQHWHPPQLARIESAGNGKLLCEFCRNELTRSAQPSLFEQE